MKVPTDPPRPELGRYVRPANGFVDDDCIAQAESRACQRQACAKDEACEGVVRRWKPQGGRRSGKVEVPSFGPRIPQTDPSSFRRGNRRRCTVYTRPRRLFFLGCEAWAVNAKREGRHVLPFGDLVCASPSSHPALHTQVALVVALTDAPLPALSTLVTDPRLSLMPSVGGRYCCWGCCWVGGGCCWYREVFADD